MRRKNKTAKAKPKKKKAAVAHRKFPPVIPDCPRFTGYKPCHPGINCIDDGCYDHAKKKIRILIINLDAMGNVLVTTSMLPAIKRKYPESVISWITLKNAYRLLDNNPLLDHVYVWEPEQLLILQSLEFDVVMNVDKSQRSGASAAKIAAKEKLGYGINTRGQIVPFNKEAMYNYQLGLDDNLKFHVNKRSVSDILHETMRLPFKRDEYILNLSEEEKIFCGEYKRAHGLEHVPFVIGFNTGCSDLYPNKKMTIEQHVVLIDRLNELLPDSKILLLGGREDTARNAAISSMVGGKSLSTPTMEGVRRGICYENLCDLVITGDSFGMHIAIALKKYVIAWFGLSCWSEIDLFDRGEKLFPENLACSPCWKQNCPYDLECITMIDIDRIVEIVSQRYKLALKGKNNSDASID